MNMVYNTKKCKYNCGKEVYWDNKITDSKIKFVEVDTKILHDYKRCAELLKEQGKNTKVLKIK